MSFVSLGKVRSDEDNDVVSIEPCDLVDRTVCFGHLSTERGVYVDRSSADSCKHRIGRRTES